MVDKTNSESMDSIAQKSSEELFLRGTEKDDAIRKKEDEDALKLDDSQEELSLQNIQRGSEQRENPNKGVNDKGTAGVAAESGEALDVRPEISGKTTQAGEIEALSSSHVNSPQAGTAERFENDDQDNRRVLLNSDDERGVDGNEFILGSKDETPSAAAVNLVTDSLEGENDEAEAAINTAPDAGEDIILDVEEGASVLNGQLMATDADSGAVISYEVAAGASVPDGFILSEDGDWQFDAQSSTYDHLSVGDSVVLTVPIVVSDEHGANDTMQIQITVNGTNDAPVAGASVSASVDEGTAVISGQLTSTDLDDGASATYSVSAGSTAPAGFVINSDGSYSFDPTDASYDHLNVGDSEVITIPVTVTDDNGATDTSQIQITVSGTNDAPVAGASVTASVDEGSAVISGQFMSTDLDDGATETYSVSVGSTAPAGFVINSEGSYSFDPGDASYEHLNVGDSKVITIPVTVTDDNGATDKSQIQITVSGTNDAPVAGASVSASVDEGTAVISGQLTSTDLDDGATATYSVSAGSTAPDGFVINSDGSYSFDPADASYDHLNVGDSEVITIPVTVTDDNGASDTSQIQITVSGTNDTPTAIVFSGAAVDENSLAGTVVAQMSTQDVDDGETFTYSITDDASGIFEVSGDQIIIKAGADVDFEQAASHEVSIQVIDSNGLSYTQTVTLTVNDLNEAPVDVQLSNLQIDEISSDPEQIDLGSFGNGVVAQDGASGKGYLMFSEENVHDRFSADPIHNQSADNLVTVKQINGQWFYDTNTQYIAFTPEPGDRLIADLDFSNDTATLLSGVIDPSNQIGGINAGYIDGDISIAVNQWGGSNNAGEFGVSGSYLNVAPQVDLNVGTVTAIDPDGNALRYTLSDDAGGAFRIDSQSGDITIADASKIDFEQVQSLDITVQVDDGQGGITSQPFTIQLSNINEAPDLVNDQAIVDEDSRVTVDVLANDSDPDAGDQLSINQVSIISGEGQVSVENGKLVFDPDNKYDDLGEGEQATVEIGYTAVDSSGLASEATLTINVTGTNDAPEYLYLSDGLQSVDIGDVNHGVVSQDGATGTGYMMLSEQNVHDRFSANPIHNQSADNLVTVTNIDGQWFYDTNTQYIPFTPEPGDRLIAELDFSNDTANLLSGMSNPTYQIDGIDAGYMDGDISINVNQWGGSNNAGEFGVSGNNINIPNAVQSTSISETISDGTPVATVVARDAEGETLQFTLLNDSNGRFVINEASGEISVADASQINFEDSVEHQINVQINDGNGGVTEQSVSIGVTDVNEAPTDITFSDNAIDENSAVGTVVATLSTADEDSGETFSYSIDDASGYFEVSGNQIIVKDGADIDFETALTHDINVEVTDSAGNTFTENFTINVNDIVENIAPVAVDDVSEGFNPANASLAAEIDFDDGVPTSMLGSVVTESSGQVGDAADFNSAKVEVSGLDLNGDPGAQTTVSMWVQTDPSGGWEMLAASKHYDMVTLNGDIGFNTAGGDLFGTDASELADGEWHHIVGVFTNGDVTQNSIYIDGVEQLMSQIQGTPNSVRANIDSSSGSLFFGSWGGNNNYTFTGSMDEVKVYNGVLSSTEVTTMYDLEADNTKWDGGTLTVQEDNVLTINSTELLANDTDPDGDALTISAVQDGVNGTVALDGDGNVVFTPVENYSGEASFSYTVSDGNGGEASATVILDISSVNDVPTINVVNTISVDEDGSQQFTYSTSDIDSTSTTLTADAGNGNVVVNSNGTITFTPNENYYGEDTIVLTATDSDGGITTQEISVTVDSIEDAPDAVDDGSFDPQTATLAAELTFDGSVPVATLGSVSTEVNGQVGDAADFSSAKVEVSGLSLNGDPGGQTTVSMWIQANPSGSWEMLAASDRYDMVMLNGDIGFNTAGGDMFGSDASELTDGQWHHVVGVFTNGDVTQNSIYIDGVEQSMSQIQGTPNNNAANIDSSGGSLFFGSWGANNNYTFSGSMDEVKVYDGVLSSDEITTLHNIELANIKWDTTSLSTDEDVSLVINPTTLLSNDIDVDGDVLSISSVQDAQHGTVVIDIDGNVVFSPDANYNGEASFTYTVDDGNGGTDTATASLNVVSVDDAPTVITLLGGSVDENSVAGTVVATLDTVDADSGDSFSYSLLDDASGFFEISGDQVVVKAGADIDFENAQSHDVSIQVTDSQGNTHTETLTLNVNDINENIAPSAIADDTMIANYDLPSGGQIVSTAGNEVTVTGEIISEGNRLSSVDHWTFSHNGGPLTIDTLAESGNSFVDIDGDGIKDHIDTMMRLYDANGNQVAVNDDSTQGTADGSSNDLYGHIQDSYLQVNDLPAGEYKLAIGSWELTGAEVAADQNDNSDKGSGYNTEQDIGPYQIKFTGDVSFEHVTELATDEDTSIIINVLGNDIDVDGDPLTITDPGIATDAAGNVVGVTEVIDVDGGQQIRFTPGDTLNAMNEGDVEPVTFTYTVSDGQGGSVAANVTVNVTGANEIITGSPGDDTILGGAGNDEAYGGQGDDTYVMNPFGGIDHFSGGEAGGWTDVLDVSAMVVIDPDNPWTIVVDSSQVEYDLAVGALDLNPDTAGVITFGDGSEVTFDGLERIEW